MRQLKKAYLEITNRCNLQCSFCPGTRRTPGFLPPEDFSRLAGRLRPHTEYLYLHLMGEPLLHPQLEDILDRAGQLRFKVMITTNGTLLDRQGPLLCACPAVEKVSVSLHSFEGNEGAGLEGYLDQCLAFAQSAAPAGKRANTMAKAPTATAGHWARKSERSPVFFRSASAAVTHSSIFR